MVLSGISTMRFMIILVQLVVTVQGVSWFCGNAWIRDASSKLFGQNTTFSLCPPSLTDVYDQICQIYCYLINDSENSRREFRELEEKSMHFVNTGFAKPTERPDGLSTLIEEAISIASKYQSIHGSEYWDYLGHEKDIVVWRLNKHVDQRRENMIWPCLKSHTTIDLPPEQLADLLMDSSKIQSLNKYSAGRTDVETISPSTKIVWNRTKIPYAIKPYDFCTLMHLMRDTDNSKCIVILSKSVVHDKVPESDDYSRSEIIFGMNVLMPCSSDHTKTDMTSINHVKYKGIPPFFVSRSALPGTVGYLKRLKEVAKSLRQ
ncbi:hypothetical protein EON65_37895 [archaeon]|nr:MAG: hypothetical protein EON65_37895 [archaeon]